MPNYVHRTTKKYYESISPSSLPEPVENYIENPDLSAVAGQPVKYWEIQPDDTITEMDQAGKDAADQAEKDAHFAEVQTQKFSTLFPGGPGTAFKHTNAEVVESAIAVLFDVLKGNETANTHEELFSLIAQKRAADQGVAL